MKVFQGPGGLNAVVNLVRNCFFAEKIMLDSHSCLLATMRAEATSNLTVSARSAAPNCQNCQCFRGGPAVRAPRVLRVEDARSACKDQRQDASSWKVPLANMDARKCPQVMIFWDDGSSRKAFGETAYLPTSIDCFASTSLLLQSRTASNSWVSN